MAPRHKRKALYELFGNGNPGAHTVPQTALRRQHMLGHETLRPQAHPTGQSAVHTAPPISGPMQAPVAEPKIVPRPVREEGLFPFAPGKVVRMPSGYLFFAGGVALALLFASFAIGYARGERAAERAIAAQLRAGEGASIVEPLSLAATSTRSTPARNGGAATQNGAAGSGAQTGTPQPGSSAALLPARSPGGALIVEPGQIDPRQPGMNYLFVALRGPEEAVSIAEFLTSNGVPAGVYQTNRATLRQVVALEGFASEAIRAQDNEYLRYRQNIRDLGREWATRNRNSQNFDDLYPVRYAP